jgi:hypothetical protein
MLDARAVVRRRIHGRFWWREAIVRQHEQKRHICKKNLVCLTWVIVQVAYFVQLHIREYVSPLIFHHQQSHYKQSPPSPVAMSLLNIKNVRIYQVSSFVIPSFLSLLLQVSNKISKKQQQTPKVNSCILLVQHALRRFALSRVCRQTNERVKQCNTCEGKENNQKKVSDGKKAVQQLRPDAERKKNRTRGLEILASMLCTGDA